MFCELEQPGICAAFSVNPRERYLMVRNPFQILMNTKAFSPQNACIVNLSYRIYIKISQWSQTFPKPICCVPGAQVK